MRAIGGIVVLVYLIVGVLVASNHHYFANLDGVNGVVSAILAVVLWPLILADVNLHIGGGNGGNKGNRSLGLAALWYARVLMMRPSRRPHTA